MNEVNPYVVEWNTPGTCSEDSVPLGNGDLGLNLWTEQNGDVVFLLSKTDAWTENGQLVKLGRVRLSLSPTPFAGGAFTQRLNVRDGFLEITGESAARLVVWVDAHAPVVRMEYTGDVAVEAHARVELWRNRPRRTNVSPDNAEMERGFWEWDGDPGGGLTIDPDTVLPAEGDRVTWCHRNVRSRFASVFENQHCESLIESVADPFLHRTFGVTLKGAGLTAADDRTLDSAAPVRAFTLSAFAWTEQCDTLDTWQASMRQVVRAADAKPIDAARDATRQWWNDFWNRSHVHVSGDADAANVTQGYVMQRWMTAASGRGAYPMKFNGSIFTIGEEPADDAAYDPNRGQQDADFRRWGSNYWFQNQRLIYWPMIANGDVDTLRPFFDMYRRALSLAVARVPLVYGHGGAVFPETMFFFGMPNNKDFGWGNPNPEMVNHYIRWHYNGGLELTAMLLADYEQTRDRAFLESTLLPLVVPLVQFFDEHATRVDGKLHFEPAAALETRQWAITPAPDIAGLMDVLPRLLALPTDATSALDRAAWTRLLSELPPLARGTTDAAGRMPETPRDAVAGGTPILWPAADFVKCNNRENPELYGVFPFRVFGVGLPELDLARATYVARSNPAKDCWAQDGIQAACLGDATAAKAQAIAKFTACGTGQFKWLWLWKNGLDWQPDLDAAGIGQLTVQNMLVQHRPDGAILLFPAWPKEWDVHFKLHAPQNTTIECTLAGGVIERLVVTPPERARDVVRVVPQ